MHRALRFVAAFVAVGLATTVALSSSPATLSGTTVAYPVALASTMGCSGPLTGTVTFVETPAGPLALTADHVLGGAAELTVGTVEAPDAVLTSVAQIPGFDAATLAVGDARVPAPPAAVGLPATQGQVVTTVGFPGGEPEAIRGTVAAVQLRTSPWGPAEVLVLDVVAEHGMSGGAVLDDSGAVVGIVVARDHSTGAAIAYRVGDVLAAAPRATPRAEMTC